MKSSGTSYDFHSSFVRMADILDSSDNDYIEAKSLPNRDSLTFNNGVYAYCSALFIDIRDSSGLTDKYKRPALAKLYRSFISEAVAVMDGEEICKEINIIGDGVWGVFDTPLKADINSTFSTAARLMSMVKFLNYLLVGRGYEELRVGAGLCYGRALVIKAGYCGSGINDVVYMGDVVNQAAKLASYGLQTWSDKPVMVADLFHSNLNDDNRALLTWSSARSAWHGDVVNVAMDKWYKEHCK